MVEAKAEKPYEDMVCNPTEAEEIGNAKIKTQMHKFTIQILNHLAGLTGTKEAKIKAKREIWYYRTAKGHRPRRHCSQTSSDRKTYKGILQYRLGAFRASGKWLHILLEIPMIDRDVSTIRLAEALYYFPNIFDLIYLRA
uniref:Uncharacterized protein n=1 Tax=Romanomermis culicivorax TaxID=13658 RepID=A0A915KN08_ROMCU